MNYLHSTVAAALVVGAVAAAFAFGADEAKPAAGADAGKSGGELFHVVSFKFKSTATPEQVKAVEESFAALKGQIPQIASLKWGTNVSPEKHDKGFTHCWVLSFKSEKDRDAYLVHDDHKKFGASLRPVLEDVFVVDFWSKE
jgi:hypothetical protein